MCFGTKNHELPVYSEIENEEPKKIFMDEKNEQVNQNNEELSCNIIDKNDDIRFLLKKINKKIKTLDKKISTLQFRQRSDNNTIKNNEITTHTHNDIEQKNKDWYIKKIQFLLRKNFNAKGKNDKFKIICDIYEVSLEFLKFEFSSKYYKKCLKKIEELMNEKNLNDLQFKQLKKYHTELASINLEQTLMLHNIYMKQK